MFFVTGGFTSKDATNYLNSHRVEAYNGAEWDNQTFTNFQKSITGHCIVKINNSMVFLIGGSNALTNAYFYRNVTDETYFFDPSINIWKSGPSLLTKRYFHACGILNWVNSTTKQMQRVIVVAGGQDRSSYSMLSVELLYLNDYENYNRLWIVGPPLPLKAASARMVELQNAVVLVGGAGQLDGCHLYKLTSPLGPWTTLNQTLVGRRDYHVTFLIPDSLADCH
jgi:hypothetical protein